MPLRALPLAAVMFVAMLTLAGCYVGPAGRVRPVPVVVSPPAPVVVVPRPYPP